ncbi:hypothetical protein [Tenacibaculum phage Larrie]|nr:hypothetical protein [Tenacibaculum phage Larrie]
MQTKTIKKIIENKLNHWLKSIKDEELRKLVKRDLFLSGGSIASHLLNEQVNDYDIYIKSLDTLKKLAAYYVGEDIVMDGRLKRQYIESKFPEALPYIDKGETPIFKNSGEEYIAEEFIRIDTMEEKQIKLNVSSAGKRLAIDEDTLSENPYQPAFLSQNAISLSNDIQIVLRFSGTSEEIHKTFDFVHAKNYYTFAEGLKLNKDSLESLLTKSLRYQGSLYPLTSIIRMKKFINRGWTMNAGEILKIMYQISQLDLNDIRVLEQQLIGVDVAYFSTLIELLRGEKDNEWGYSTISKCIDKIFNDIEYGSNETEQN